MGGYGPLNGSDSCRMTEDFVIKYLWSACGYALMSIPLLFPGARQALVATGGLSSQVASRTESMSIRVAILNSQTTSRTDDCCSPWPTREAA